MPYINRIREKAAALSCTFERGLKKGAGYVLVDGAGEKPLGADYSASLADIERYLDQHAHDLGIDEVETGLEESKPGPTTAEIEQSISDHPQAIEIKWVRDNVSLVSPSPGLNEKRRRLGLTQLMAARGTSGRAWAFERMSDSDKAAHSARLREALAEDERIEARKLPTPTSGDVMARAKANEEARKRRVFWEAEQRLKTNLDTLYDHHNEADWAFDNGWETPEEIFRRERERLAESLPPEAGPGYTTPQAPAGNVIVKKHQRRVSRADVPVKRRLLELRNAIRDVIDRDDRTAAGELLLQSKALRGHGAFAQWVETEIGITQRSAQRLMRQAKPTAG